MSSAEPADVEALLRRALQPVEPPEELAERLEATLVDLTTMAADELEAWELSAMRDPRNWVRPAAAVVVGTAAGTALVLVRARQRARRRPQGIRGFAGRTFDDLGAEARKLFGK
jgi:hypothetical protein